MFTSVSARSASAYKRASIDASVDMADAHQLVNLLFETFFRTVGSAKLAMAARDIPGKCQHISYAIRVMEEGLIGPLDMEKGGEIAINLKKLYSYCVRRLVLANAKNDPEMLDEVVRLIEPVSNSWKQIDGKGAAYLKQV